MASALSLPFAIATSATTGLTLSVRRVLAISALGVIGTGIAYILNYRIIADIGATRASLVTYIVPVVAVAVGVAVLDEPFEWRLVAGGVVIIAGLALLRERRIVRLPIPSSAAIVLLVLVLLPLTSCSSGGGRSLCSPATTEALDPDLRHLLPGGAEPTYPTDPPTSGPHTPGAALKGVLTEPLSRPAQVAVLEGGTVLIQHDPALSAADRELLRPLAGDQVVIAPNPALPARVVATAWLAKQTCSGVDDVALRGFIRTHAGHGPGTDR